MTVNAQTQKGLDIDGEAADDMSGTSVSMAGVNTVAVGAFGNDGNGNASGQVRVFSWNGVLWEQKGLDIDGETVGDLSGWFVNMADSNTLAVGAIHNDGNGSNAGHVRIYSWNGSNWTQKGLDIDGEAVNDNSGWSTSMPDSNTVAIGAINNGNNVGHVRIYSWVGNLWIQKGLDIEGEAIGDFLGYSVSMSDSNTIAIGAPGNGNNTGHARIYTWNGSQWVQKGLDIDGEALDDFSGSSVSMPNSNTVAIGAPGNENNTGHARIYTWNGSQWVQKGLDIDGEALNDYSGSIVSMPDSNTISIGAYGNNSNTGHVRIYNWDGTMWSQNGTDIDGESINDNSSSSISMPNANTIAIGANNNDGNGNNAGHTRIYSFCTPITGTDTRTECSSYTWIDGNTYTTNNTTATYIIPGGSADKCDSTVILNLSINTIDTTTITTGTTITANATGANYQWIDCNNGNTSIAGATSQLFTATSNGDYAVIVTQNSCSDTSACVTIVGVGINENINSNGISIYPNPTNGSVNIDLGNLKDVSVKITDVYGKVVYRKNNINAPQHQLEISQAVGLYFIEVTAEGQTQQYKIIKK